MTLVPKYWHLEHFTFSEKLTRDEMEHMCQHLVMKRFKKGERIRLNSGKGGDVYFLKQGVVKITTDYDSGEEGIKHLVKEGEIYGILNVMKGENVNDFAIAIEDCIIFIIDVLTLKQMMIENKNLNNHLFKLAGLRIQKLERKLASLIYKNAETRVKEFIIEYLTDFGQESGEALVAKNMLSNKDIGKLTSTSRQTVNKVLNELKLQGYLHYDHQTMVMERKNLFK